MLNIALRQRRFVLWGSQNIYRLSRPPVSDYSDHTKLYKSKNPTATSKLCPVRFREIYFQLHENPLNGWLFQWVGGQLLKTILLYKGRLCNNSFERSMRHFGKNRFQLLSSISPWPPKCKKYYCLASISYVRGISNILSKFNIRYKKIWDMNTFSPIHYF